MDELNHQITFNVLQGLLELLPQEIQKEIETMIVSRQIWEN